MIWLWVVVLVIVIGAIAIFAAGRDTSMAEAYEDRPDTAIPSGRALTADDLHDVRFTTAVRGYRMDEVDAFIDRLREEYVAREHGARTAQSPEDEQPATTEHVHVHEPAGRAPVADTEVSEVPEVPEVSEAEKLGVQPVSTAEDAPPAEGPGAARGPAHTETARSAHEAGQTEQPEQPEQPEHTGHRERGDEPDDVPPQGRHSATGPG